MLIDFDNLEPVQDLVPAALITVNGTAIGNTITVTEGPNSNNVLSPFGGAFTGFVRVDSYESIEFTNKGALILNGDAGNDVFSLSSTNTPTGLIGDCDPLAGVQSICVNGGDSNLGDTLIVNGVAATTGINVVDRQITGAFGTASGSSTFDTARSKESTPLREQVRRSPSVVVSITPSHQAPRMMKALSRTPVPRLRLTATAREALYPSTEPARSP